MITRITFAISLGILLAGCGDGRRDQVAELCQEQLATIRGGDSMGDSKRAKACNCALEKVGNEVGEKLDEWLVTYVAAWNSQQQGKIDGVDGGRRVLATMEWQINMCTGL